MLMKRVKMEKGYIDSLLKQKGATTPQSTGGSSSDWPRLVLLLLVMVGFVIGFIMNAHFNNPRNVLRYSVNKMAKQPFSASIEGTTSMGDSTLATYRYRQAYIPGKGITDASFSAGNSREAPFNSLSFLESLRNPASVREDARKDMFGHPTRHFYGEFRKSGRNQAIFTSYVFEYWVDMQSLKAVRLTISGVDRNAAFDAKGDFIAAATYLNIRYY